MKSAHRLEGGIASKNDHLFVPHIIQVEAVLAFRENAINEKVLPNLTAEDPWH